MSSGKRIQLHYQSPRPRHLQQRHHCNTYGPVQDFSQPSLLLMPQPSLQ